MVPRTSTFFTLLWFLAACYQANAESIIYKAAVLEYSPTYSMQMVSKMEAQKIMVENVYQYQVYMKQAYSQGAQIIVLPEDGLYGAYFPNKTWALPYSEPIPDVDENNHPIPCNNTDFDSSPILQKMSCLASQFKLYTVFDMADYVSTGDDYELFNTQVALSNLGEVIAKYHKTHLYYEPSWVPGTSGPTYFDTSFGVRFGMMICFDMMFKSPQDSLLAMNIRDFTFSTWWVNFPPALTATQVQQGWSSYQQANLLAAGIGLSYYNSGSGIYASGVILNTTYNPGTSPSNRLLVSELTTTATTNTAGGSQTPGTTEGTRPANVGEASVPALYSLPSISALGSSDTIFDIQTFTATPGLKRTLTASTPTMKCTADFAVADTTTSKEQFAVVAAGIGTYGAINATYCTLQRCTDTSSNCTALLQSSSTYFSSFSLSAQVLTDIDSLPLIMLATNNTQLVDSSTYETKATKSYGSISSSPSFEDPLLSTSVFYVVWP